MAADAEVYRASTTAPVNIAVVKCAPTMPVPAPPRPFSLPSAPTKTPLVG